MMEKMQNSYTGKDGFGLRSMPNAIPRVSVWFQGEFHLCFSSLLGWIRVWLLRSLLAERTPLRTINRRSTDQGKRCTCWSGQTRTIPFRSVIKTGSCSSHPRLCLRGILFELAVRTSYAPLFFTYSAAQKLAHKPCHYVFYLHKKRIFSERTVDLPLVSFRQIWLRPT